MCDKELKVFADSQLNAVQTFRYVSKRVGNNVGKGENPDYQHFLLVPHCFPTVYSSMLFNPLQHNTAIDALKIIAVENIVR